MTRNQIISALYEQRPVATRIGKTEVYRTVLLLSNGDTYTVTFNVKHLGGLSSPFPAVDLINFLEEDERSKLEKKRAKLRERKKLEKRKWRSKNVIRDIWYHLRSNAARRKILCTISLEDFTEWCMETGYHLLRGRAKEAATIDRKIPELGYIKGNLQILTLSANVAKRWTDAGYYKQNKLF